MHPFRANNHKLVTQLFEFLSEELDQLSVTVKSNYQVFSFFRRFRKNRIPQLALYRKLFESHLFDQSVLRKTRIESEFVQDLLFLGYLRSILVHVTDILVVIIDLAVVNVNVLIP